MALKILQTSGTPFSFDVVDSELSSFRGGEVVTLTSTALDSGDASAADAADGYANVGGVPHRTLVTRTLTGTDVRPLYLADDGIAGYGTVFGSVVGGTVGTQVVGQQLGPSTASGSGKLTCWGTPGLFAVSLDSVDDDPTTGLVPTNTTLLPGAMLSYTDNGLLTPEGSPADEGETEVARFVEFNSGGSLVTTPNSLVTGLYTPLFAVIHFNPR